MRYTTMLTLAGLGVAATAGEAGAFGRGGYAHRGAAVGPRGAVAGGGRGGAVAGPFGAAAGGSRGGTYVGPRGTTVQAGRAGGVATGPFGGVHAGGAAGARVTTPGGQTYARGRAGGASVGPAGGVRAGGVGGVATTGPYGTAAAGRRGGVAVGPNGGAVAGGSRGGFAAGPYGGFTAGGMRGGVAVCPYGARVGGVAVGHATGYVSPYAMRSSAAMVRTGYRYPYFTPTWYAGHRTAWVAPRWVVPVWTPPVWGSVATFVGVTTPPAPYDYGSSVVIQDDRVFVDGTSTTTAGEFAAEATTLADAGRAARPADSDEWHPLGQFGLVQENETVAQRIFQLGINRAGVVRGNYYDAVADNTLPVYGSLDKGTQRVAWSIGEKKDIVFEAGLSNLTRTETAVLVHYGKERTQQLMLVRLEEPRDEAK